MKAALSSVSPTSKSRATPRSLTDWFQRAFSLDSALMRRSARPNFVMPFSTVASAAALIAFASLSSIMSCWSFSSRALTLALTSASWFCAASSCAMESRTSFFFGSTIDTTS